jgi:hypothetical protein
MKPERKFDQTLRVRMDAELLEQVKSEVDKLDTDVSTYVRWCIRTGLYLDNLNTFLRSKIKEDEDMKKRFLK